MTGTLETQLQKSFCRCREAAAQQYPQYSTPSSPQPKCLSTGGELGICGRNPGHSGGAAITWWRYPDKAQERAMLAE